MPGVVALIGSGGGIGELSRKTRELEGRGLGSADEGAEERPSAAVFDHYSRGVVALKVFKKSPSAPEICAVFDQAISQSERKPKHLITDKGSQFWCRTYKSWCRRRRVPPRFGAVGRYGSIAVIERFIRSLKSECTRALLVPYQEEAISRELELYTRWYNRHRPNQALGGLTPVERRQSGKSKTGASSGSKPRDTEDGTLKLSVSFLGNRRHLPIVKPRRAA